MSTHTPPSGPAIHLSFRPFAHGNDDVSDRDTHGLTQEEQELISTPLYIRQVLSASMMEEGAEREGEVEL
jgi:hypothetical protein